MVDSPTKIYNDYVRANLPNSMSYDTGTDRYDINNHSFFKFKNSNWYYNYISKYGYSAFSAYAVNNFEPALVFDFKGNYFRKIATASTFAASITHAATTNATMVDSDGLLKWRPHNLMTKSNTFDTWSKNASTVIANNATGPYGVANTADTITLNGTTSNAYNLAIFAANAGDKVTIALWVRSDTLTTLQVSLNGRTTSANNNLGGSVAVTPTWTLVSVEATVAYNDTGLYFILGNNNSIGPATAGTFEAYGAHMFRSDLGGMVNNPDTSDSCVPTTSAPVYLSRRGHHIHDGSAWVNEGILHESEARTNLLLNSGTLATQSVTVAAVATTLSFTGTGTVTLSGVSTAGPLVGTGTGENNRVNLTFTPTAGTLTLTVSGTVTNAQLEAGATPSSYIPTTTATATRAAETLTVPAANLPYNSTNMSIQMDGKMTYADTGVVGEVQQYRWQLDSTNYILSYLRTTGSRTGQPVFSQREFISGYHEVSGGDNTYSAGTNVPFNGASRHGSTFVNGAHEGTLLTASTTPTILPALSSTDLQLGYLFMGTIGQFRMWDEDITDAGITEAST